MNEPLNVLVVDADAVARRSACRALLAGGRIVRVEEAATGAEALARLEGDAPPDVLLLGDFLPDGDGLAVLRRAAAQGLTTPVVMLTGHADELAAVELMKAGAADCVAKSGLTPEALWRSLHGVLRLRHAQEEAAAQRRTNRAVQRQNEERLRFLYDITTDPDLTFDQKLNRLLEEGRRQFGLDTGMVTRGAGESQEIVHAAPSGGGFSVGDSCDLADTFCGDALRRREALGIEDAGAPPWSDRPAHTVKGVGAYLGAAIHADGQAWGTLCFVSPRPRASPFAEVDKEYARLMAQWIGGELRRHQAEQALRESEERFRLLMENVLDYAILVLDKRGCVAEWNVGAERILGYRAEEILGREAALIFTPEDRAAGVPQQEMHTAASEGRADDERWHVCKDGRRFFASGVMTPLRDEGGLLRGYSKILRDATERKHVEDVLRQSERRYRSLADATAQIVWTTAADGQFAGDQSQWSAFTGQSPDQLRGWGWLTAVHPEDQWRTGEAWASSLAGRTAYEIEHRLRRRDGVYRSFTVRAVPVREEDGALREWVGVHTDITERKQAEARLSFLAEVSTLLAASLDHDQTLAAVARLAVPTLADGCLVDLVEADGRLRRVAAAPADSSRAPGAPEAALEVIRTGHAAHSAGARPSLCVPLMARGRTLGAVTLVGSEGSRPYGDADLELALELARRAALAVDNARLFHETRARAEREGQVNAIGQALRASLDPDEILRVATREVGQALGASRCTWMRLDAARGVLEVGPHQYAAPGVTPDAAAYPLTVYPPETLARWRSGHAVSTGNGAASPAFIAVPVFLRGEWAGLFTVQQLDRPREWTADEIALMVSLADTLALALENARLYAREHRVADMLQAAFLPDIPDHLHGLDLAKAYRSGLEEAQVGGDLYDAFALPDGRVALVIADVSGKGLGAAVQTATVKYTLRAFAAEAAAPGLVLHRLNRTLRQELSGLGEHFVTLFYAVYEPQSGRLAYASAGHEDMLIKRAAGGATLLPANGPILGLTEHSYGQDVVCLYPGDSLVLFTDGLTEARAAGTRELLDMDRVAAAVAGLRPEFGPGAIVASLENLALDWTRGRPQDDLALLVARRPAGMDDLGAAPPGPTRREAGIGEFLFGFAFPASPDYAAEVRQAVAHWMSLLGYDRAQTEDFQTAVTEAVTNAVRHGSPRGVADTFRVSGHRLPGDALAVEVADSGPGLSLSGPPEMPTPNAVGGRGLPLMHALADELVSLPSDTGLRLRLVKARTARDK